LDSKILLGIIAITFLGTISVQQIFVEAGIPPIEIVVVTGNEISLIPGDSAAFSNAQCPPTHQVIGGSYSVRLFNDGVGTFSYDLSPFIDLDNNRYRVVGFLATASTNDNVFFTAIANCAKINFPISMDMIGGVLLDIDTVPLLVAAIGTNPIITALVGITLAGVAGQAVWFVHRRKKSKNS